MHQNDLQEEDWQEFIRQRPFAQPMIKINSVSVMSKNSEGFGMTPYIERNIYKLIESEQNSESLDFDDKDTEYYDDELDISDLLEQAK